MRREGRLHGYEFDREESQKRVKACTQPTNRSKFRSKFPQEKAGLPRYKSLKKIKGQRNKAHASDVAANHKLHEWALRHTRCATLLADSFDEADLDPSQQPLPFDALKALLLTLPQHEEEEEEVITNLEEEKEEEDVVVVVEEEEGIDDEDSDGSDWLDLGSTIGSDDDWFVINSLHQI